MDIHLHLPWPPTINNYYLKGRIISSRGRIFRENVLAGCYQQGVAGLALQDKLAVTIILYPPDKRTRDLDNYLKPLQDALTHARFWEDDVLVDQLHVFRGQVLKEGSVSLHITEAGPTLPVGFDPGQL